MMKQSGQTVVLGAGIQGTCIALELARRKHRVLLVDQDPRPLNRTSVRNEGKIHLGLVYANDRSGETARLLLHAALKFFPLLQRWLGAEADRLEPSTPFDYLVAAHSLLTPDELERHYRSVEEWYHALIASDPQLNYLGEMPDSLFHPLPESERPRRWSPEHVRRGYRTAERALDTGRLADLLRRAIEADENIEFLPNRKVRSVSHRSYGFRIEGEHAGGPWHLDAEQVVNATWASRQAIDLTLGIEPESHSLHRLKYRVLAHLPDDLCGAPSVTMVLGRFGDVVVRPDQTVYLSWYPAALRGWHEGLQPPDEWEDAVTGRTGPATAGQIAGEILRAIDAWYPGMGRARPYRVDAGVIFAHGRSDVDDAASLLHRRDRIGVRSHDGYHSVSTGKFTTAPLFAVHAADAVAPEIVVH